MKPKTDQEMWDEVMKLSQKYGYIVEAYGGTAILICHDEQKKQGIYEDVQKMNGRPI